MQRADLNLDREIAAYGPLASRHPHSVNLDAFGPPVPSLACSSRNAPGATNAARPPATPSPHAHSSSLGLGMNHVALSERVDQPLDSPRAGIGTPGGCDPVEDGVAVRLVEP